MHSWCLTRYWKSKEKTRRQHRASTSRCRLPAELKSPLIFHSFLKHSWKLSSLKATKHMDTGIIQAQNNKTHLKIFNTPSQLKYIYIYIYSFFNSSRRATLYIVYFTVPRRLYYRLQIGRLLWFWRKSGLECTKYFISPNFFILEPLTETHTLFQWRRSTTVLVRLSLSQLNALYVYDRDILSYHCLSLFRSVVVDVAVNPDMI